MSIVLQLAPDELGPFLLTPEVLQTLDDLRQADETVDREYYSLYGHAYQFGSTPAVKYRWVDAYGAKSFDSEDVSFLTSSLPARLSALFVDGYVALQVDENTQVECSGTESIVMRCIPLTARSGSEVRCDALTRSEFISMMRAFLDSYESIVRRYCHPGLVTAEFAQWLHDCRRALSNAE